MNETTRIKAADWVIAWDDQAESHIFLRHADVVFAGDSIVYVGAGHTGAGHTGDVDVEIDGSGLMVMPGLVNVHSHAGGEPMSKGLSEETGSPLLHNTGLIEYMPLVRGDQESSNAALEFALCELLKSGCTTLCDLSGAREGWLDILATSGIRAYAAPMFRSAHWYTPNGHELCYEWSEDGGSSAFAEALAVVDAAEAHPSGRLKGMVSPSQIDTCTPELLQNSAAAARERGLPWTLHASQSVVEFREMVRRHGKTPIEWLGDLGLLGPDKIIAHAIFLDHHPWLNWPRWSDLDRLGDAGAAIAHCPNNFVRRGILLQDFASYRDAGVTIGIGADSFPHNIIDEMRWALTMAKVATADVHSIGAGDVLEAAAVGGASALGRDDLGRLAPGAKADLLLVDLDHPTMQPLRDPLRNLIFSALERPVRDVYVDGNLVVNDGEVLTLYHHDAARRLNAGQKRALEGIAERDWAGRSADEAFPLSLEVRSDHD
jgi:cytosine/adenosine deaminase-related metal-dependent hydrolase